ncbi:unnamed protein product [Somion occarium]|uniref:Transmembrane protein n=1 Tax=Somion occarium TaxID=3059160 RepID=A0ABP1DFK2_9APHY
MPYCVSVSLPSLSASLCYTTGMSTTTKFPSVGLRVLTSIVQLIGVSILSYFISRRLRYEDFKSLHGIKEISWPRLLVVLTFTDSWLFIFTTGVLIHGAGLESSVGICTAAIAVCIAFYTTSKIFIWLFLAEKVYVVWSSTQFKSRFRFKCPVYLVCFFMVMGYAGICTLLVYQHVSYFRDDGACVIGLKALGTILLLSWDMTINVGLTGLFLWPLIRHRFKNVYLRKVAKRAVIASFLTLVASTINILLLTIMDGQQLGWVCLTSCGADVIANASVLFWVTSGTGLRPQLSVARNELLAVGDYGNSHDNSYYGGRAISKNAQSMTERDSASLASTLPTSSFHGPPQDCPSSSNMRNTSTPSIIGHPDLDWNVPAENSMGETRMTADGFEEEGFASRSKRSILDVRSAHWEPPSSTHLHQLSRQVSESTVREDEAESQKNSVANNYRQSDTSTLTMVSDDSSKQEVRADESASQLSKSRVSFVVEASGR